MEDTKTPSLAVGIISMLLVILFFALQSFALFVTVHVIFPAFDLTFLQAVMIVAVYHLFKMPYASKNGGE